MIYFISEIMHRGSPIGHQSSLGEEARLRARIARDTRRLAVIGSRTRQLPERYIASAILDKKRFAGRSYAAFLLDTAHATRGFELWDDIVTYFRRFRLISTAMRLLSVIISAIEAGAAFIIAAGVVLALSPAAALCLLASEIDAAISTASDLACVRRLAQAGGVTFVFPPRDRRVLGSGGTLTRHAAELSLGGTVLIVSPYTLSPRGAGGRGAYSSMRREADGVFLLRRRFYFKLRRKMEALFTAPDTVMIYL